MPPFQGGRRGFESRPSYQSKENTGKKMRNRKSTLSNIVNPPVEQISQSKPLNKNQVENNAGGYVYSLNPLEKLNRFLILGAMGGTYYVGQEQHVMNNYLSIKEAFSVDFEQALNRLVEVSVKGLAQNQDPAIFALAVACSDTSPKNRGLAFSYVPEVCRTFSTLTVFLDHLKTLGKKKLQGRQFQRMINTWYSKIAEKNSLGYQMVKYRERNGWRHEDVIRLGHPKPDTPEMSQLFRWVLGKDGPLDLLPKEVIGYEAATRATTASEVATLIRNYSLPREAVPNQFLNSKEVWSALLPTMPLTAMIRNLGNMTKSGVFHDSFGEETQGVLKRLGDKDYILKSRVHPITVLLAKTTYERGKSFKGDSSWNPVPSIVASLDQAFYLAFHNLVPSNKRILVGLDVSGSMGWGTTDTPLTPRDIGAAICMCLLRSEPLVDVMAFSDKFMPLDLNKSMSLTEVVNRTKGLSFSATDCALPLIWAQKQQRDYDAVLVITDSETWSGEVHVDVALAQYREKYVKDAKFICLGTTATPYTVANPNDRNNLNIAGFSADVPTVISEFLREV
jgi:60 kDa SS-A/Ro ribonucleoprotein